MKRSTQRAFRREAIDFIGAVLLFVRAGFDLTYGWAQVSTEFRSRGTNGNWLFGASSPRRRLSSLSRRCPVEEWRPWFRLLQKMQVSGAPVESSLTGFLRALEEEEEEDVVQFIEALPRKTQWLLVIVVLPPALVLMCLPIFAALSAL